MTDEILSHPVKKAILEFLHETNGSFFGDIVEALPFSYSEVLQNLIELKQLGIVSKRSEPSHFVIN
ncbi:MAG TPA: winged helix-turn-helix domain-containing protein [Bacteroidia bacterium]|nr:winged helix-turn-helix transcriptional regulator [Sphingobacteriales bacterium]HPD65232.1 winged helix-turn-helix domain-containing protein [Bacteroidia bacterium]HRS58611.1 winged helix-turn-helix domain-containing protein [Bacteroidia bacterium]HRU68022.1 winged helix-turn-helix domain-containing protein [Bacteroidia bacterium]